MRPNYRDYKVKCCDCGLVHRVWFRIHDGHIEYRVERDGRATGAARRAISRGA